MLNKSIGQFGGLGKIDEWLFPAGTTHLSLGPGLNAAGSVTMDDIGLFGNG